MRLFHTPAVASAVFDEPNLVSAAGLVPVMALARRAGLGELAQARLSVPSDKGANAGAKICSLVAGMAAGADSIEDMGVLRHGAMGKIIGGGHAPSTLGSFLRAFTFGRVRQLDAVASRFLRSLAAQTALLGAHDDRHLVMVDIDDTIVEVHGYKKQGAGFGYSGVRGLNALLATVSTAMIAPVVAAQRLRKGSCGSPRGAARLVSEALAALGRTHLAGRGVLVRADSALCRTRHNAESDRTVTCPVAPALRAVTSASATRRAAPLAEFVAPRRSRVATITGADNGVETIPSNAFKPLTLEYPWPAPCF